MLSGSTSTSGSA